MLSGLEDAKDLSMSIQNVCKDQMEADKTSREQDRVFREKDLEMRRDEQKNQSALLAALIGNSAPSPSSGTGVCRTKQGDLKSKCL